MTAWDIGWEGANRILMNYLPRPRVRRACEDWTVRLNMVPEEASDLIADAELALIQDPQDAEGTQHRRAAMNRKWRCPLQYVERHDTNTLAPSNSDRLLPPFPVT